MSEAEKKWREWDAYLHSLWLKGLPTADTYKKAREAYKSALRREIEKRIPESPDTFDEYVIGTRAAMKTILELLDTVEPND